MNKQEVAVKIIEMIHTVAEIPVEDISIDCALMDDLELSSLEIFAVIAKIERTFQKKIPGKDFRYFVTVGNLVDYVFCKFV